MIPVNEPLIGDREIELVTECLRTGWISSAGRFIEEFEERWAAYCSMEYGVAMCNGTAALSAAVSCLDLQPGDEVIMPSFTIISCPLAVIENGGVPVLVDCDPNTWTIDVELLESKITHKTRAIMPVHIYGHPCDMEKIREVGSKYNLSIIEDAAEAHGAEYKNKKCGSFGDISCFSFYANKIITTGEGGMALTRDPILAEKLRSGRNLAFQKGRRFYHTELGHNYRLTNLQAAIGIAQLERIDTHIEHKRWIGKTYSKYLSQLTQLQLPVEEPWAKNVYWMYGIVLSDESGIDSTEFATRLYREAIETRPFFLGIHEQPVFRKMGFFNNERYPVTEKISRQGLYLPSGLSLTEETINRVCDAVIKVLS